MKTVSLNGISKALSRDARAGWLTTYPTGDGRHYYRLGPLAVDQYQVAADACEPLNDQALLHRLAVLQYCCCRDPQSPRLSRDELREYIGEVPNQSDAYCLDSQTGRLALLRVIAGSSVRHIPPQFRQIISKHEIQSETLRDLIRRGRFMVVFITTSEHQSQAVQRLLGPCDTTQVIYRTYAIPQLFALCAKSRRRS